MAKPSYGTEVNTSLAISADLSHVWAINEGGGTTLEDGIGTADLTLVNMDNGNWGTVDDVLAVTTNGVDEVLDRSHWVIPAGAWSYMVLFQMATVTDNDCCLALVREGGAHDRGLGILDSGKLSAYIYDGAVKRAYSTGTVSAGEWHVGIVTCDGDNLIVYLDGTAGAAVEVANYGYTAYTSPDMNFGRGYPAYAAVSFGGLMMWDRALNATEAGQLASDPWAVYATGHSVSLADGLSFADSNTPRKGYTMSLSDGLGLADGPGASAGYRTTLADVVAVADLLSPKAGITLIVPPLHAANIRRVSL
jgi:hypothetical protein